MKKSIILTHETFLRKRAGYCLSAPIHPFCLLCENGPGPLHFFSLPTGRMLSFLRQAFVETLGGERFSFLVSVLPEACVAAPGPASEHEAPPVQADQQHLAASTFPQHLPPLCAFGAQGLQ